MSSEAEEVERLRRVAFGPGSSAQERATAEASLRRLEEQERPAASGRQADSLIASLNFVDASDEKSWHISTDRSTGMSTDLSTDLSDANEAPLWRRRINIGWLVPIAIGAMVLGAVGTLGATDKLWGSDAPTPNPSASTTDVPVGEPIAGDLEAADARFDQPFVQTESFPESSLLESFGVAERDVRLALVGGDLGIVWVGRTEGKLCLFAVETADSTSSGTCVPRDEFAIQGIHLGWNSINARWYGQEVFTVPPMAGRL